MLSVATKLFSQPQLSGQDGEEASIVPSQADFQERSPTPENSSKMHLDTANEISQSTRVETPCVSRRNTKELKNPPATQMVDKAETDPESEEMTDTETDFENIDPTGKTPAFVYARAFDCIPLLATPHALKVDASRLSPKQHNVKRAPMPSRKARRTKDGPELPSSLIKNLFSHYAQVPVSKDAFKVVERSVSVYFKHLSNDLKAFANHAGRKTAEPADMELLMRRQGLITEKTPLNVLIEQHMPLEYRELLLPIATSGNKVVPPKLK
nr:PREDICTED: centromere protein T [Anolis carolinensis]|eukprot:XP_008115875.1 PREDICTED: centromere protein T [Anolis carolinensis]